MVYENELFRGASCLADIHSVKIPPDHGLISPRFPLRAILEECEEMLRVYMDANVAEERKKIMGQIISLIGKNLYMEIRRKIWAIF